MTYRTEYQSEELDMGMVVEVTKHPDPPDSIKWLLHEVERGFRDTDNMEAWPDEDSMVRVVENNRIFFYGGGVIGYRWTSNNIVVNIQYTNLSGPKPEPLDVVKAYLAKLPSSIIFTNDEFKAKPHNEQWVKTEMDRRLWLCDKWFYQLQLGKAKLEDVLQASVKNMEVFLNYREKYYGIPAQNEKQLLWGYRDKNDGTSIKAKLKEYKDWWNINKDKTITLP